MSLTWIVITFPLWAISTLILCGLLNACAPPWLSTAMFWFMVMSWLSVVILGVIEKCGY